MHRAAKLGRFLLKIGIAYAIMVAILWAMQDRFVYPAPDRIVDPPPGYEVVMLQTADGLALRSFALPAREEMPTVVYFHGNGSSLDGPLRATRLLAEAGYGLLLVEYRGYGGNPGEPSEQGFYRDGRAALSWLSEQGVPNSQTIFAGNSIGSGTAVQMAREYTPCVLMLTAPFLSLPETAQDALPFVPAGLLMRDRFDNAAKIGNLDLPLFIMHGREDRVVPFEHGKALAGLAKSAAFRPFDSYGHELSFRADAQAAQREWLDQLLGGGACT